jgi:ribonuclease VapC
LTAIVVDTSAVVAILRNEPEKDGFVDAILAAAPRFMSAVSLQEAGMAAAGRLGDDAILQLLDALLVRLDVEIVAHDVALARIACEAFLRFGKDRHPARSLATVPLMFWPGPTICRCFSRARISRKPTSWRRYAYRDLMPLPRVAIED